ncbi:hypothetical protein [Streptomyces sp. NPDC047525]|uniref:hypothetical protein n=1 Tax=Streptomyces sp. NPDC047525 TaxID=3155264 RepID=UPI0033C18ABE
MASLEMVARHDVGDLINNADFSFHRENLRHDVFEVSITDALGSYRVPVRGWVNMIRAVVAFTSTIAHQGMCTRSKADIYRTGYCMVNGFNVRVTPLS